MTTEAEAIRLVAESIRLVDRNWLTALVQTFGFTYCEWELAADCAEAVKESVMITNAKEGFPPLDTDYQEILRGCDMCIQVARESLLMKSWLTAHPDDVQIAKFKFCTFYE